MDNETYRITNLGKINSIVMVEDWNNPDEYWTRATMNCTVLAEKGSFRINTDKYPRAENGCINGTLSDGTDALSMDAILIATLVDIIRNAGFIRAGTPIPPLDEARANEVFERFSIPRQPYGEADYNFVRFD